MGRALLVLASVGAASGIRAEDDPSSLVSRVSREVIEGLQADPRASAGDPAALASVIDAKVLPSVDLERWTALAVGRYWSSTTPEQRRSLQAAFKGLLVRSYAGALMQVNARLTVDVRRARVDAEGFDAVVGSRVMGNGEPIAIEYRLHRDEAGWRIYDVSLLGVWLGENYRNSFAQQIRERGIDGLIERLAAMGAGSRSTPTPR